MNGKVELATFGGGCFWGVEARFNAMPEVLEAISGYMGGDLSEPDYAAVCGGNTGHAEVVQVRYAADAIGYDALLAVFFELHNPTTLNRQGPDVGSQYRSVIFFHSLEQEKTARQAIADVDRSGRWSQPLVTQLQAAMTFWPAEEYHQHYLEKNGLGLCAI